MENLELLRKVQNSKKPSISMPLCVRLLEEHHERLLRLEALVSPSLTQRKEKVVALEEEIPLPPLVIPENISPEVFVETPRPTTPEPEPEEESFVKPPEQLEMESKLLDELLATLERIRTEASVVEEELKTVKQLQEDHEEEEEDDDKTSINTECTDACRELIATNTEEIPDHSFDCKHCIKEKAKAIKRAKKQREKEKREQAKRLKEKQKSLLQLEQQEIAMKLKHLRMGLDTVEILNATKKRVSGEYNALATEYYEEQ